MQVETKRLSHVRATIQHFAERVREAGLSPDLRRIEIEIVIEQLREEHGITIKPKRMEQIVNQN